MIRHSRYTNLGWKLMDAITCILLVPFEHVASLAISTYIFTCFDRQGIIYRILRYFVLGPVMILFALVLFPPGVVGYVIWMLINALADIQPFMYVCPEGHDKQHSDKEIKSYNRITVCSANICVGAEHLCKINNQRNSYWRVNEIGRRLLLQDSSLNKRNLVPPVSRENVILSKLPDLDVIMLQEVFSRFRGYQLYRHLKDKYPYCIYDVGYHTLLGNHGGLGSGLFVASKYPVMEAKFHPFAASNGYGHFCNLGVLVAKLDLGIMLKDGKQHRGVGYLGNMHAQAYQGPERIIAKQLEEAEDFMKAFIHATHNAEELNMFTVIGGDFNCDNMSPGDVATQTLPLWNTYIDPCRERAGEDKAWAVGTEHRQRKMNHPSIHDSETFREILLDDVQRRHFIIDADVVEQTMDLMVCPPKPDADGEVRATKTGGCRRIDYLAVHKDSELSPMGFWFSTVIGGLTDHIPVVLMLETKSHLD